MIWGERDREREKGGNKERERERWRWRVKEGKERGDIIDIDQDLGGKIINVIQKYFFKQVLKTTLVIPRMKRNWKRYVQQIDNLIWFEP